MTTIDNLKEITLKSTIAYKGKFLQLKKDEVKTPDGVTTVREYIHHPGASAMIPLLENGNVILELQYRYPLRKCFLEIPAGKLDQGESPLACAQRELVEETGYEANDWLKLGKLSNAIGYSDEEITIFLARDLREVGQKLDVGENLRLLELPWQDVVQKCLNGEITDVKTLVGVFWLQNLMNGKIS